MKVNKKNGERKSFWRKSTAVQSMKRQCRKAEWMWRKMKLKIHYSIYKNSLHAFNAELAIARQTFFLNFIINNLNNTRTLFASVQRLTVCGYTELYDTTSYIYKNRNTFCNETGAACRSPSHDTNSRLLCSEFHV